MKVIYNQLKDTDTNPYSFFRKTMSDIETETSRDIKVISEVEKIWILYDVDENGTLDWDEVKAYITEMAFPHLNFTDKEVEEIYN